MNRSKETGLLYLVIGVGLLVWALRYANERGTMTATGIIFGRDAFYDNEWRWLDTRLPVHPITRLCPKCSMPPTLEGYDPCIGHVGGAVSVCCGHGRERGHIKWGNDE